MSVVLRCPSCQAKLRLDASPPVGTMIDCPKCGTEFPVRNSTSEEPKVKPPDESKPIKKGKRGKVVETQAREFMNEFALLGIVGGAMLALIFALGGIWFILNRAARVEDLIAAVPESYPVIRGVNLEQMRKMPGYKGEVATVYTKEMQEGFDVIAKGLGVNVEKLGYLIIARSGGVRGSGVELYLFRIKDRYDRNKVGGIENIRTAKDPGGRTFYAFDAGNELPFLRGTVVDCPTSNLIVVTRNDLNGVAAAEAANLAVNKPAEAMNKKIGDVGKLALKSHFWTIIRSIGTEKAFFTALGDVTAQDKEMTKLANLTKAAPTLALWSTFGSNGLRCGAGIECATTNEAKELLKAMQEGPLGKGDESNAPNYMRTNLSIVGMKKTWGEFLQSVSYNQQGKAAYIRVKFDTEENRRIMFDYFTAPYGEQRPAATP